MTVTARFPLNRLRATRFECQFSLPPVSSYDTFGCHRQCRVDSTYIKCGLNNNFVYFWLVLCCIWIRIKVREIARSWSPLLGVVLLEGDCQFCDFKCGRRHTSKKHSNRAQNIVHCTMNEVPGHRHWQWPLLATSQHRGVQRNSQPGQCAFDEAGQVGNCGWPTLTLTVTKLQDHTSSLSSEEARPLRATKRSANMNTCVFFDAQPLFVRRFSTPLQNSSQGLNSVQSHAQSSPFLIDFQILHSFKLNIRRFENCSFCYE